MDWTVDIKDPIKMTNASNILNKCNQCDYLSPHFGNLRKHMKGYSWEISNKCNWCDYASFHLHNFMRHLCHIYPITAPSVIMHSMRQAIWRNIWEHTLEKSTTNATNTIMHTLIQLNWGLVWNQKKKHKYNQCEYWLCKLWFRRDMLEKIK